MQKNLKNYAITSLVLNLLEGLITCLQSREILFVKLFFSIIFFFLAETEHLSIDADCASEACMMPNVRITSCVSWCRLAVSEMLVLQRSVFILLRVDRKR